MAKSLQVTSFCDGCGIINRPCRCREQVAEGVTFGSYLYYDVLVNGHRAVHNQETGRIALQDARGRDRWVRNTKIRKISGFRFRRIWPAIFAPTIWTDERFSCIAHIVENDPGVRLAAYSASGEMLWTYDAKPPRPLPWAAKPTPRLRKWQVETENMAAFFPATDKALVFAVQRTTSRHRRRGGLEDHARLELRRFDPRDGSQIWARNFDEINISQMSVSRFDGLFASHAHGFARLNFADGSLQVLLDAKGMLTWPMSVQDRIACAWQDRGQLHTAWLDQKSGRMLASHSQACAKPKSLLVHPLRTTAIVQVDQRIYMMLDDQARPAWQVRLPHWFRSLHEFSGNLLRFGLSSNIVDVNRSTGRVRRNLVRPLEVTRKALLGDG